MIWNLWTLKRNVLLTLFWGSLFSLLWNPRPLDETDSIDGFSNEWIFPSVSSQAKRFHLELKMTLWETHTNLLLIGSAGYFTRRWFKWHNFPGRDKSAGFNYAFIWCGAASRHRRCLFTLCDLLVKAVCYVLITHSLHAGSQTPR